jgi:hypothetical protein
MMKTPINTELRHLAPGYDPQKAHDYYVRTRKLKGRQPGAAPQTSGVGAERRTAPRRPHPQHSNRAKQKQELASAIKDLQLRLNKLEELIKKKEETLKKDQSLAKKKNQTAKEKDKPKSAADKAKAARENKKFRQKHKQSLKTKAKQAAGKSGGGSHGGKKAKPDSQKSIADLKALATKVKGQLAVAKQKLAAL